MGESHAMVDASRQEQANLRQRITDLKAEVRAQAGEIEHYEKHVAEQDTRMMRISELEDELHGTKLSAERGITKVRYRGKL